MQWRQNTWLRWAAAGLAVVALIGGGSLWFWLRSTEHRVSKICGGMLPAGDTAGMISDAGDLRLEDRHLDRTPVEVSELSRRCKANNIWVTIEPATGTDDSLGDSAFDGGNGHLPVPLGSGWTGFVVRDDHDDAGAVLLDCANWGADKGEGLYITVRDSDGADTGPENRASLVRVLTGTALRAAEATGCEAEPAEWAGKIAPLPPETPRKLSGATGTCAGTTSQDMAREAPAGTSPVEVCILGPDVARGPGKGIVLTAKYGPYAVPVSEYSKGPAGVKSLYMWGSAVCGGPLGTARYTAVPRNENRVFASERDPARAEPPTEAELADLARFAEASAERHGCEPPAVPPVSR